MSKPIVYGTVLPIVIADGATTTVFGTNSIQANSSVTGTTSTGVSVPAAVGLAPYAKYAALSAPVAELLASLKDQTPRFTINRTLRVNSSIASFVANSEPFSQRFAGFGSLSDSSGESTLDKGILTSTITLLPASLQKRDYTVSDELLLTF